jgi:uncharacterized membrane protein YebE (DUF533 family)
MLSNILGAAIRGGLGSVLARNVGARVGGGAMGGLAGQAAVAAAMGLLMRGGGAGRLVKVGGLAALGMMAFNAYKEHQSRPGAGTGTGAVAGVGAPATAAPMAGAADTPSEAHQQALMVAMIAAAKADGHVDEHERAQIEQVIRGDGSGGAESAEVAAWFNAELKRPLDAAAVAQPAANDPDLASKLYLISAIVVGGHDGNVSPSEHTWLQALEKQLRLPEGLAASLRQQAKQVA